MLTLPEGRPRHLGHDALNLRSATIVVGALMFAACAPATHAPAGGQPASSPAVAAPAPLESIAFGSQTCDSCRMVIARPAYAAQVYAADGRVLSFDDPGCLVIELEMGRVDAVHGVFHHVDEERWIALEQAGFVRRADTPMGFGYGAVDGVAGELGFAAVRAAMAQRFELRR